MDELWKVMVYKGEVFSDDIEVSNRGRLRNRRTGTVYRLFENQKGYLQVCLAKGRAAKRVIRVHRAVAETFLPAPEAGAAVNHKDGCKRNNEVSNLEWCTPSANMKHAYRTGLMPSDLNRGELNGNTTLSREQVEQIRAAYIPGDRENGTRGLARRFGVDHMTISRIIRGLSWA